MITSLEITYGVTHFDGDPDEPWIAEIFLMTTEDEQVGEATTLASMGFDTLQEAEDWSGRTMERANDRLRYILGVKPYENEGNQL